MGEKNLIEVAFVFEQKLKRSTLSKGDFMRHRNTRVSTPIQVFHFNRLKTKKKRRKKRIGNLENPHKIR